MTVAIENPLDSEKIQAKAVANLRRANVSLQEQLHSALSEVRDTEYAHNKAVSSLEADLESLRLELSSTLQAAVELENEKRRLAREKVDAIRESQIAESADMRVIHELQKRVRSRKVTPPPLVAVTPRGGCVAPALSSMRHAASLPSCKSRSRPPSGCARSVSDAVHWVVLKANKIKV
ncbi:hypothetical protein HK405_014717 [Cladochytrium tenue]|nr:hypothetical protein HK405_014717 [Cladochytrium tenue]